MPSRVTQDQFLDFLAQKFRDRAKAFLEANPSLANGWPQATLDTVFAALTTIPSPPTPASTACQMGGDRPGTCTYQVGQQTFIRHMTCSQCEGLHGDFTPDP